VQSLNPSNDLLAAWIAEASALIFDCDGTLVDTMPAHYQAWCDTLEPYGCQFPHALFQQLGGMPARRIIEKLNAEQQLAMPVDATAEAKEKRFLTLGTRLQPIEVTADLARRWHGRKPMAVASGGIRPIVLHTLQAAGLDHLFALVVTSDDVVHGKPAPDTYLLTAERLGVPPEQCVVFEDAPTGIAAAHAAHTRCAEVRTSTDRHHRRFTLHPLPG